MSAYRSLSDRYAPPLVSGHEFSGIIDSLGEGVTKFKVGQAVTAYPILYCGKCWFCKRGFIHLCVNKQVDFFARAINIYGSYMHTNEMYEARELVASKKVDLRKIVTSTYAFEDTKKAFDVLNTPNNKESKILIKM